MTFQATPGPDGKPVFMMQGGPPGMTAMPPGMSNNPDEAMQNFFRRSDRNQDGRLDREEASSSLRERFEQYDTNRDGAIDLNEYRPYIQERMGSRGDQRGPGGSFDPRNGSMMSSQFPNGPPGGWGGSPGGWSGGQDNRSRAGGRGAAGGPPLRQAAQGAAQLVRGVRHRPGRAGRAVRMAAQEQADGRVRRFRPERRRLPDRERVAAAPAGLAIERRANDAESGSVGFGGSSGRGGSAPGGGARFQFQPGGMGGKDRSQPGAERGGKERGGKDRATGGDQGNRKDEKRDEKKRNPFTNN